MENVTDFMRVERERLTKERRECEASMAKIDAELAGIEAYFAAMGKEAPKGGGRRSGVREGVRELIAAHPDGLTRDAILVEMGVKGDKSASNSVSNALTNLKKQGVLTLKDRVYRLAGGKAVDEEIRKTL